MRTSRRCFLAAMAAARLPVRAAQVKDLSITILSTMLTETAGIGEWGFAALVEADGRRILFDTGARPDTVLINARELNVNWASVDTVIISHNHGDHTGGLTTLRRSLGNERLGKAYIGRGALLSRPAEGGEQNALLRVRDEYKNSGGQFLEVDKPVQIADGLWLTGPVPRLHPERNYSGAGKVRTEAGLVEDTIAEDMSLVCDTPAGLVILSGCGHAGIVNTLEYAQKVVREAPVHAAIGGFHLFSLAPEKLDWTAARLRPMNLRWFIGAHCTGIEATMHLRRALNLDVQHAPIGSVGMRFTLSEGARAHRVRL